MTENYNILVNKLNAFRLKYNLYRLLKGSIITFVLLIATYTAFSLVEYFVFLSPAIRKVIVFSYLFFGVLLIAHYIIPSVLRLLHVLKPMDPKASSGIIQNYFKEIEDKLLNIIELADINDASYSNEIIVASIDQKIAELKVFDFNDAVQFKNVRFIAFYLVISLIIATGIFLANKNILTDSTYRLVYYNQQFVKPAPFKFELKNNILKAKKGDSFVVRVNAKGDEIPKIVYINIEGNNYLMKTINSGSYEFEIASVINPVKFYFSDLKYNSETFSLKLLPKPGINSFRTLIEPPKYTTIENKEFENIGDVQVPNGTKITWSFNGMDVDSLFFIIDDSIRVNSENKDENFVIEKTFYQSCNYNVYIRNKVTEPELSLSYKIDVIPDLFPEIEIIQVKDSIQLTRFFFKGTIGDDYGFSALKFHYNIENNDSAISIPLVRTMVDQEFYYSIDFKDLDSAEGTISYYFSVSDNDQINKYKTTTSNSFTFKIPDREELLENEKERFEDLQKMVEESQSLAREIQKDMKNLQMKNMDTNISNWEKSQMVNDIVQKQNKLEKLYDKIREDNKNLNNYLNSFNEQNQKIVEKQKLIEQLLEEVFTDELKELMDEFNKLAEEFDGKKLNELSKNMDLTMDDLQKQLDRNLDMLKKLKVEQKVQDVIDAVKKMADEEDNWSKEVVEKKNFEEINKGINEHQENLLQLQEQLNEAIEMNEELEEPIGMDNFEQEFNELDKSIEKSKENLDKKNRKKSGSSIKNNSEQMKNLAFAMQQMMEMNSMQQNKENIQNLKQILSNLILLSFTQEDVLSDLAGISAKDPRLVDLNKKQKSIVDNSKIVRDSLYSLAMRTPHINSMVNNEIISMETNLNKASEQMEEALFTNARSSQQFVITAANNLALMLNEALEQLEKQQANSEPGNQQCENPGQGSSGMNNLKESSESIKQQLQKMIEQMKSGNQKGLSKQMGQNLMQHEMMQQMLRDLMNNGNVGSGTKQTLKQIDEMLEQNRKELMNRSINAQIIARQNLITTRLLEAEKAEFEREFEDKRESESAEEFYSNPVRFFEYKNKENYSIEYLNKNSHKLSNFYNKKYKNYINSIQKQ